MPKIEQRPQFFREIPKRKEAIAASPYVGLHARLLLSGEALNKNVIIHHVDKDTIPSFHDRNYSPYQRASTRERGTFWKDKDGSFEEQQQEWIAHTTTLFSTMKDYLASPQGQSWKTYFNNLGDLNLDVEHITPDSIKKLYDRYFSGDHTESQIKRFIEDSYTAIGDSGDQSAMKWLSNMFGSHSKEVIEHLYEAEDLFQKDPEALLKAASAEHNGALRINTLSDSENNILDFLNPPVTHQKIGNYPIKPEEMGPVKNKLPGKYYASAHLKHYRPEGPLREFPDEKAAHQNFEPEEVAKGLKKEKEAKYKNVSQEQLAEQIRQERTHLQETLNTHGITEELMHRLAGTVITQYEQFITNTYGVTIPTVEKISIFPISGKTAEYYHTQPHTLAFVNPSHPVIHLNIDNITKLAKNRGLKNWGRNPQTVGSLIQDVLIETFAHEYTHIIADHAFWKLNDQFKRVTGDSVLPSKAGIATVKPRMDNNQPAVNMRGRGLTEAVTEEVTRQWLHIKGRKGDETVYPQERQVLYALVNHLEEQQHISKQEAFKKVVSAYFDRNKFNPLVRELSGQDPHNKTSYKHPHFVSIMYSLMDYEQEKNDKLHSRGYPLTIAFISDALTTHQKQEINRALTNNNIELTPRIADYVKQKLLSTDPLAHAA